MRVTGDGRVGIGTTAPSKPLHVVGSGRITGDLQVEGGDIEFNQSSGQARLRNLLQDTYMRFSVNVGGTQTNAINIRGNNGFVGIGSAEGGNSPIYPLDVYNASADTVARFTSGDNKARLLIADNDTEAFVIAENSKMSLGLNSSSSTTNLTIDSSGQVGIGETAPAHKLEVSGNGHLIRATGTTAGGSARIGVYNEDNGSGNAGALVYMESSGWGEGFLYVGSHNISAAGGDFNIRAASGLDLTFGNGTTEYARISGSGNFGIGTTTPGRKFTVQGGSGDNLPVRIIGGSGTNHGSIEFQDPNTTADYKVTVGSKGDDFYIQSGGGEKVRVKSDGKVGIGTTAPTSKLDVRGRITTNTGTVGTVPNTLKIITASEANTAQGDVYAALEFHVTGAENSTGTLSDQIVLFQQLKQLIIDLAPPLLKTLD